MDKEGIAKFPDHLVQGVKKITAEASSLDQIRDDLKLKTIHQINLTINGAELHAIEGFEQIQPGTMTTQEYDLFVADLVNFMV